jgi:two-component system NtrC family sensor kinase
MHKLLVRQLRRFAISLDDLPHTWRELISAVDEAYAQADTDRTMLERSLDLSSDELFRRNQELRRALELEKVMRNQAVQSEKLAAMGQLLASIAHELNNPLQMMQTALFLVQQNETLSTQAQEDLQAAATEAKHMAELISRLREAYRLTPNDQFQLESINAIINDILQLIATYLRHNDIVLVFEPSANLPLIFCNRSQLRQVFLNLYLNGVEAMPGGGTMTVRTSYQPNIDQVLITISDTGFGIDPAILSNIFNPFFTTKENGTGLGLSIVYEIVQQHKGRIEVESKERSNTTFKVWLPVEKNQVLADAILNAKEQPPRT